MNFALKEKSESTVIYLKNNSVTVSTAESCTGGMLSQLITDVSGASAVFPGGIVSYSNSVKENILGVSQETLTEYGAVSEKTAEEMCIGAKKIFSTDISVSITGIAGPTGGTNEKPVGTVCFGINSRNGVKTFTEHFDKTLGRNEIRCLSASYALDLIITEAHLLSENNK